MSKKGATGRDRERQRRRNSSLRDHKQRGKVLQSPLAAAIGPALHQVSWARDVLPDHLWVCHHLAKGDPDDGVLQLGRLLDTMLAYFGQDDPELPKELVTGQLTDFQAMSPEVRARLLEGLEADGMYEWFLPEEFAHSLGMYPDAPGRWLIQPWLDRGLIINPTIARSAFGRTISQAMHGQDPIPTRAKMISFRQELMVGRIAFPPDMFGFEPGEDGEVLTRWPKHTTPDESARIEATVRSMFLTRHAEVNEAADRWSKTFWRANWSLYPCEPRETLAAQAFSNDDRAAIRQAIEAVDGATADLWARFRSLAEQTDPDLYDPDRYEVLTGLVGRVLRYISAFAAHPALWSMEQGAPLVRAAVETRIMIRYMDGQPEDQAYTPGSRPTGEDT